MLIICQCCVYSLFLHICRNTQFMIKRCTHLFTTYPTSFWSYFYHDVFVLSWCSNAGKVEWWKASNILYRLLKRKEEPWRPAVISPEHCLIGCFPQHPVGRCVACVCVYARAWTRAYVNGWSLWMKAVLPELQTGGEIILLKWRIPHPPTPSTRPPTLVGANLNESHQWAK